MTIRSPWGEPPPRMAQQWNAWQRQQQSETTPRIRLIGDGPVESSTTFAIERQPFCWDCNGFYRRLGLPPGAPRIEVARAYMDLNGHRSALMTNAVEVLLSKHLKPLYDSLPLGKLWPYDLALMDKILAGAMQRSDDNDGWAYYLTDDIDPSILDEKWVIDQVEKVRHLVSIELQGEVQRIAMGIAMEHLTVIVGYRMCVLVDLTLDPCVEYARLIAASVRSLLD